MYKILKYEVSSHTNKVRESTILRSFNDVVEKIWKRSLNKDCHFMSVKIDFLWHPKKKTSGIPKSVIIHIPQPETDDFEKFKKELENHINGALEMEEAKAEDEYNIHRFTIHLHICDYDGNKVFPSTQYPISDIPICISDIQDQKKKYNPDLVYRFVLKDGDKEYSRVETKLKYIDSNFWSNVILEMINMCINENQDDNEELMKLKSFMGRIIMKTNKSKLYVYSTNKTVSNIEDMKFFVMPTEVAVDDMYRQQIMYHPNAKYKLYYIKVQNDTGEYYRFGCIDRENAVWQYKDLFETKDIDIQDHYIEEHDLPSIGYHYLYEMANGKTYVLTDDNFVINASSNSSAVIPYFPKLVMVTKSYQVYLLGDFYYKKPQYGKEEYSFSILDYFSGITEAIKAKESMAKAYKRVNKLSNHTVSIICVRYGSKVDENFQIQLYAEHARNKKKFHHEVSDIPMIYFDKSGEIAESVLCADSKLDDFKP